MDSRTETSRFAGLDGLRGIAAIAVLACHVPDREMFSLLPSSYLAVDLFFILSGFVLSHAYERRLTGGLGVLDFMRLRLVRLYPLYLLGTLIMTAVIVVQVFRWRVVDPMAFTATLFTAVLFLPTPPQLSIAPHTLSVAPNTLYPLNYPAWSLFFELVINVVFAVLAPHLNRRTLAIVLALGLGCLTVTLLVAGDLTNVGVIYDYWLGGLGRVTFTFFAGVVLYRMWRARHLAWLKPLSWLPLMALLCVFAVPVVGTQRTIFDLVACLLLFPAIVLASANAEPSGIFARVCLLLGAMSYAVYALQVPIIYAFDALSNFLIDSDLKSFGEKGTLIVALILFATAFIADTVYDTPIRRWLMAKSGRLREPRGDKASEELA